MKPGTNAANSYNHTTPPPADLSDPADGEVWLDLVAREQGRSGGGRPDLR